MVKLFKWSWGLLLTFFLLALVRVFLPLPFAIEILIFSTYTMGCNFLLGRVGFISFGQPAYLAVGAYGTAFYLYYFGTNPLIGKNDNRLGPRFPDMSKAYNPELCAIAREYAKTANILLHEGTYVGLTGPSFETPAEYRFLNIIGGDTVGMSTVPEVIVANHMGMRVFGMSVVTNNGLAIPEGGNQHAEVLDVAAVAAPKLEAIFGKLIETIA